MIFKLLNILFVSYSKLIKDSIKLDINEFDGCDHRFINLSVSCVNDEQSMIRIRENYRKKNILDKLQSDISIINKVTIAENLLNENVTYGCNIHAGGLFKDWEFEI